MKEKYIVSTSGVVFAMIMVINTAFSQTITIDNTGFQSGPFGQGSTIGAPVVMSGCFKWNNTIRLFLCNPANPVGTLIGVFNRNGFFTTFLNGTVPNGILSRTDYYLEARTDRPVAVSNRSTPFEIRNTAAPLAFVNTSSANRRLIDSLHYGYCSGSPSTPRPVTLVNQSTPGSVTSISYKDEITGVSAPLPLPVGSAATIVLDVTYYTMLCKAEKDGVFSTRYFSLVNPTHNSGLNQSGEKKACLPDPLSFTIDITSGRDGIGKNFPGVYYVYDWGSTASNDTITHCQMLALGGLVSHVYTEVSCGKTATVGGSIIPNAYPVDVKYVNPFSNSGNTNNCDEFSNAAFARIFQKPIANFTSPNPACAGKPVIFVNTTISGVAQSGNSCTSVESYEWYINDEYITDTKNLTHTFSTPGTYRIKLKVENASCAPSEKSVIICVEPTPAAAFKVGGQDSLASCAPLSFAIQNLTTANACAAYGVKWRVFNDLTGALISPSSGVYTITTGDTAFQPSFTFLVPGRYRIELTVTSSCGTFQANRIINIIGTANVLIPQDRDYCNTGVILDFGTDPAHKPIYNSNIGNESFQWTVTGGAFSFLNGTSATSKYPVIYFADSAAYTVTLQFTNNCGFRSVTQHIAFSPAVTADAGPPSATICFNQDTITLAGKTTGTVVFTSWKTNGAGKFSAADSLSTVYTLSAADKTLPALYLVLQAFTPPTSACKIVSDTFAIKVLPNNTGVAAAKSICSGGNTRYSVSSSVAGSTFTWTSAVVMGSVTGNTVSGTGNINDVLFNNGTAQAKVVYTIIPEANGCPGDPFTLTVTILPKPVLTLMADSVRCSGEASHISLNSAVPSTVYSWVSTVISGSISGNSSRSGQAVGSIEDVLKNTGTVNAIVSYQITPVAEGCPGDVKTVQITIAPGVGVADAGQDQKLCAQTQTTLTANAPSSVMGRWTQVLGPASTIVNPDAASTQIRGLISDSVYQYVWEITGASALCGTSRDTVTIFVRHATTQADAGKDTTSCRGDFTSYTLQGNLPATNEKGTWTIVSATMLPLPTLSDPATADCMVRGLRTGTLTLRWSISSDAAGCATTADSVTINIGTTLFQAMAGNDQVLCRKLNTNLSANLPQNTSGSWSVLPGSTAVVVNPFQPASAVTGLSTGQNVFVWSLANGICPASTDTVIVTVLAGIENKIDSARVVTCPGQPVTLNGGPATGGNGTYRYQWQQSTDNTTFTDILAATATTLTVSPNSTTYYRRMVTSLPCIEYSNTIMVTVNPNISGNTIAGDQNICVNTQGATVTGSTPQGGYGPYIYQWQSSADGVNWTSIPGTNKQNYEPGLLQQNTLFRRLVSSAFCNTVAPSVSNQITVKVNLDAKALFRPTKTRGCPKFEINPAIINLTPFDQNSEYRWFINKVYRGSGRNFPTYTMERDNDSITIKLVVTSRFECRSDSMEVGFATGAPPTVKLGAGADVVAGTVLVLQPVITNGPIVRYTWTPAAGLNYANRKNPQATIDNDIVYKLEIENTDGCTASDTIRFKVHCERSQVYIPNAFSPDGDGKNDVFMIRGTGISRINFFRIKNRWGQQVFEKNNSMPNLPSQGWDGKVNGRITQEVYTYWAEIVCTGGEIFYYSGDVSLILMK